MWKQFCSSVCNAFSVRSSDGGIEDSHITLHRPQYSCSYTGYPAIQDHPRRTVNNFKAWSGNQPEWTSYGTNSIIGAGPTPDIRRTERATISAASIMATPTIPSRSGKPRLKGRDPSPHKNRVAISPRPVNNVVITEALRKLLGSGRAHYALFQFSSNNTSKGQAFGGSWNWENPSEYVRIPISSQNLTYGGLLKWDIIKQELTKVMFLCETGSEHVIVGSALAKSLKVYNASSKGYNFRILDHPHISQRLRQILPTIVEYAIQLEYLLGEPIPFLKEGRPNTIYVTRRLACSLLAQCFLCAIPHEGRPPDMPYFHFLNIFHMDDDAPTRTQIKIEKMKCILEYFSQMANLSPEEGDRIISFERRYIPERKDWARSETKLCNFWVNSKIGIESADGMLQVDFANKRVGGGILSDGMVMEEIRFAICPELILSRLFTKPLTDDEVLVVTGTRQFTLYSGYGANFRFENGVNITPSGKDFLGREFPQVVAMDALHFSRYHEWTQYQKENIDRELHKCYVGFSHGKYIAPVATGNWGCGIFNGDKQLKILLQWMAASVMHRPSISFHISSEEQSKEIEEFGRVLKIKNVSIGKIYRNLMKYPHFNGSLCLFDFILTNI